MKLVSKAVHSSQAKALPAACSAARSAAAMGRMIGVFEKKIPGTVWCDEVCKW